MKDKLLELYHYLPASLKSLPTSIWGAYLRSWRYGPETKKIIEESIEREKWSLNQWKVWQEERLAFVLHRAATKVPYYRKQWAARRRKGDFASLEYLENWPILKKENLRKDPIAFVADDCNVRYMYFEHTSGTSGTPLKLWWGKTAVRQCYALFEARARQWNGVTRRENWSTLGGQLIVPANKKNPPFWVWNAPMNQLYLSSNHLSNRNIFAYIDALKKYNINHIVAYSSSASYLANEIINNKFEMEKIKLVITNGEPLNSWQKKIINRALAENVKETYGMAELVAAASECQEGKLHLWPEVGFVEILSDIENVHISQGKTGRLVATGLLNADMPLIRYEIGDRGRRDINELGCKCGRTLPIISGIEGRTNILLITPDRRRIFSFNNALFCNLSICEAQFIQEDIDLVRVRFVPAEGFTEDACHIIRRRIQKRMGAVRVILEKVDEIPRGANGKFRAVISQISPELNTN